MSGAYPTVVSSEPTLQGSWPDQSTQPATPPPTYAPPVYGAAAPYAPDAPPTPVKKKRGPARAITAISIALLVAVILGLGGYTLYNVFAANADAAAAKVLPDNTLAYASIDIVQYAKNSHSFSASDLFNSGGQGQADPIKSATGLNWQTDILPWVNRDIALAAFPASLDPNPANPFEQLGAVVLIQSKDDSAAQNAMKKAADFQQSQGHTVVTTTYGGFTLYTVADGGSTTFAANNGWAIIGSNSVATKMVIDRINGKGNTLANAQAYQDATSSLPSDRFGTVFVNIKAIYALAASAGGNAAASTLMPFASVYPTAGGYLEWNSAGMRAQITLKAAKSLGIGDLHGDTTALASMVPQNVLLYGGIGNLGAEAAASSKINSELGNTGSSSDIIQSLLGVNSSDPALQHPAAIVVTGLPSGAFVTGAPDGTAAANDASNSGVALLLKAPDASAAQTLLQNVANAHQLTLQPMTVDGQSATGIYSAGGTPFPTCPECAQRPDTPSLVAVAVQVKGTLVVGTSSDLVTAIINAANGGPNLAQQSDFSQLTQNAPSDAATTVFVNLSSLQSALANLGQDGSIGKLLAHTTALLITSATNDQQSQETIDLKVNL
jgi:hypothetical protein